MAPRKDKMQQPAGEAPVRSSSDCPGIPAECVSPPAPPWQPFDQCVYWYEPRFLEKDRVTFRITYEHCLRLLGRQPGPLLYTLTLLPGETARLYHHDRYRRIRSAAERVSVHTSLRQTVAALWQTRIRRNERQFQEVLVKLRSDSDASISVGGSLFPVSWSVEDPDLVLTAGQSAAVDTVSEEFQQVLVSATQQVEAERSLVISSFEDQEATNITSRTLTNHNSCRAVTYFVRRVLECYELHSRVKQIFWRSRNGGRIWAPLEDKDKESPSAKERDGLPRVGEEDHRGPFTVPTDGALYEAELAHCSSCEPARQRAVELALEKAKSEAHKASLEVEMLAMEVARRKALLDKGVLEPFAAQAAPGPEAPGDRNRAI